MGEKNLPKSMQEVIDYVQNNPDLKSVDPVQFWKYYAVDADPPWTDSRGKPVKNWKQKLRTWAFYSQNTKKQKPKLPPIPGKTCSVKNCLMPAVYKKRGFWADTYYCAEHMPEQVKQSFT